MKKGTDEKTMMIIRRTEAALTEVGKLPHQHHFTRGRMREKRERQLKRKTERIGVETGKSKTEFKHCTVKALFKVENLLCHIIIRLLRALAISY